ncbi:MAG TPA: peptidoglycan DD-metalloendopeptidase family protein [Candidatus Baltobacteraceae bacterium]
MNARPRPIVAIALAVLLAGSLPFPASPAGATGTSEKIRRQQRQLHEIHLRLGRKRNQLQFETLRESDLRNQLDRTNGAIAGVNTRIGSLQAQAESNQRRIAAQRVQLDAAQRSLKLHDDLYKKRLVEIYEHGNQNYLDVLFSSRSFSEFVERWHDVRLLLAVNRRAIASRKSAVARVARAEQRLDERLLELQSEQRAQSQARAQLAALAQERGNLVSLAHQQRVSVAGEVQQLEGLSAQEEAQLEGLIREQQAEIARENAAKGIVPQAPPGAGQFIWPVSGPITSPYGWRPNPYGGGGGEFHPGIDIGVASGTTIVAAASGRVIIAGWVSGYGNYVAIDHGGGISTGYGHMSQIFVGVGQNVQRGQAIGASGCTGRCTGPHVHFEVRRNGAPVDPNPYLH